MVKSISVNQTAWNLVEKLLGEAESFGVLIHKTKSGTILIDAGINAKGGFHAGKLITEICLGGYGSAEIFFQQYQDLQLPSIFLYTDYPIITTLGSQFAGWHIKLGKYSAIASGPGRALALKPKELYEQIHYLDQSDVAVLVLETTKPPPENVISYIADECDVTPENLALILVPTATLAGSTQISGRIVETGVHKLTKLGFDPKLILHACGYAPIAPVISKFAEAMGRTNDAIMYAGVSYYTINCNDDERVRGIVNNAPSSASKSYGKPFSEIFKEAENDFYKIDPGLFAPAVIIVNNIKTGTTFTAGKINVDILKRSLGF